MATPGVWGYPCSIDGCDYLAIVIIRVHGDGRTWHACSSEHARAVILDIKEKNPSSWGITTRGINHDKY